MYCTLRITPGNMYVGSDHNVTAVAYSKTLLKQNPIFVDKTQNKQCENKYKTCFNKINPFKMRSKINNNMNSPPHEFIPNNPTPFLKDPF